MVVEVLPEFEPIVETCIVCGEQCDTSTHGGGYGFIVREYPDGTAMGTRLVFCPKHDKELQAKVTATA